MARNKDIQKELAELNSPLADMPTAMPFTVPTGYFEQLSENVLKKNENTGNSKSGMPHNVPEGYFDSLPQKVIEAAETKKTSKPRKVQFAPARWVAAAVLIITITIGGYNFLQTSTPSLEAQLSSISESEILAYVEDNIDDFEAELLEEDFANFSVAPEQIDNNSLEDYLEYELW